MSACCEMPRSPRRNRGRSWSPCPMPTSTHSDFIAMRISSAALLLRGEHCGQPVVCRHSIDLPPRGRGASRPPTLVGKLPGGQPVSGARVSGGAWLRRRDRTPSLEGADCSNGVELTALFFTTVRRRPRSRGHCRRRDGDPRRCQSMDRRRSTGPCSRRPRPPLELATGRRPRSR